MGVIAPAPALAKPKKSPSRWRHFYHMLARHYMDYYGAMRRLMRKKRGNRAIDIDMQHSREGTPWGLHWNEVGKNHLHDPLREIPKNAKISDLSDGEIDRLRDKTGKKKPHTIAKLLDMAAWRLVRVELEGKTALSLAQWEKLLVRDSAQKLLAKGLLQYKTLAALGDTDGSVERLTTPHELGVPTILSFYRYKGKGIRARDAWPVTDYVRGKAKWIL